MLPRLSTKSQKEPSKQLELFGREIAVALEEAIVLRQKIGELGDSPIDDREKGRLFWDAQDALDRVRLIGDVVVGAFFAHEKEKEREAERLRREELVRIWLLSGGPATTELLEMQREIRSRTPVFHWMAEFPEIFHAERPDPLDQNQVNRAAFMDAFMGNPPFAGKNVLSRAQGPVYLAWLTTVTSGSDGNADLVAYFFRRSHALLGDHGCFGFIATKVIAEGLTRETGLLRIVQSGGSIYFAEPDREWPGSAGVSIAVVCVAKGRLIGGAGGPLLDGRRVTSIASDLTGGSERSEPAALGANGGLISQGLIPHGSGFYLTRDEYQRLCSADATNRDCMLPALGGDEVLSDPSQSTDRFIVYFGDMTLEQASTRPLLIQRLAETVKHEREELPDSDINRRLRRLWWRFWTDRPALTAALTLTTRCLVTSVRGTHSAWAIVPSRQVFLATICVVPLNSMSLFGVLQSRAHEAWVKARATSRQGRLTYSGPALFDTFPFPKPDPRAVEPAIEAIGQRLYEVRAKYMIDEDVGLTITYNRLKDRACDEGRILELRMLHEEMDQKVIEAYAENDPEGHWLDLKVPPFCPLNDNDTKKSEVFGDAVIDRLFVLNAKRADEEKVKGLGVTKRAKAGKMSKSAAVKNSRKRARKGTPPSPQLTIAGTEPVDSD